MNQECRREITWGARVCMQKGEWFGVAGAQNCVAGVVRQNGRGRQG